MLKWITKVSTQLLSIVVVAVVPTLGAFAVYFRNELAIQIQQALPQTVVLILTVLTLSDLALFAWVLYLLPSFKYVPKFQVYQHRVNGLYYCPPCRNKQPLSPLKREVHGWSCPFCSAFYKDPDYKPLAPTHPSQPHA